MLIVLNSIWEDHFLYRENRVPYYQRLFQRNDGKPQWWKVSSLRSRLFLLWRRQLLKNILDTSKPLHALSILLLSLRKPPHYHLGYGAHGSRTSVFDVYHGKSSAGKTHMIPGP